MDRSEYVVQGLRARAAAGESPSRILGWLYGELGEGVTMFSLMRHLFLAFNIPLSNLRDVEDWSGFGRNGKLSDDDLNRLLGPLIPRT